MRLSSLSKGLSVFIFFLTPSAFSKPIDIGLRLKEKISIETLAESVLDPQSPRYQRFYSPDEIRKLAAPSKGEYKKLIRTLRAKGLEIVYASKSHLFITVRGEPQLFEQLFSTKITFSDSNRILHENTSQANLGSELNLVESVVGLDNTRRSYPHFVPLTALLTKPNTDPATIKDIYGFNSIYGAGINGGGQDIAIATYDGFKIEYIRQYYSKINLNPVPTIEQVKFNGEPNFDELSAVETAVDGEFSGMIAPGAHIRVYASAHNDDLGEVQIFTAILDDNKAKIANYSWGDCEAHVSAQHRADMDKVFNRAVAQGVNIFIASGDTGAAGCQGSSTIAPDWPAAHPSVVAVGGTTMNISNGQLTETAWSGSGGGVSTFYDLPAWQSGFQAPYTRRSFPDVAFNADPKTGQDCWVQYQGTLQWLTIGGTSIAAPQWAGFMALVNQSRGTKGSLGFLNPLIYGFDSSTRSATFHDVTSGDNKGYNAGVGWDAVTGWGSMKADALLKSLQ